MSVILEWNGIDLPDELRTLPKGQYVVTAVAASALTEVEEAGLEEGVASLEAGEGISLDGVRERLRSSLCSDKSWITIVVDIVLSPEAFADLEQTITFIHQENPRAAARLEERIFAVMNLLADGTLEGPQQTLHSGKKVRSWPVPPLRVYYRKNARQLQVVRIYHQARRPIVDE